jgi:RNA polymerase sigma-70 factor (sigma-E family)
MTKPAWTSAGSENPGTAADTPAATLRLVASVETDLAAASEMAIIETPAESMRDLYDRCHADMVRFAAFLTGQVDAAEDVAQDAFVRVFDAWDRIEDPTRAEAYLKQTVVNLVRGGHRREQIADRHADRTLSVVPSAEEDALGELGRQRVLDAVASLPMRQRACVVMRHWMRMTETEIAETLDLSVGSVRTHAKRGTKRLQSQLGAG